MNCGMIADVGTRRAKQLSFCDYRMRSGRGGPRAGAGRKPSGRRCEGKRAREQFQGLTPLHVTVRVAKGLRSLRTVSFAQALEASFAKACARDDFRLVHYSIQRDHLHLIVEAEDNVALGNGMKSISARIAHSVKRVFQIPGKVLDGVYHARRLTSPRQVRNALRYVLLNARKHWQQQWGAAPPMQLDRASSARWFDGWSRALPTDRAGPRPVAEARSWLLCRGWRRHGLIDPSAVPQA